MSSPSAGKRRMDTDVIKLIESKHEVTILGGLNEFCVKFYGPRGTPYEGGLWKSVRNCIIDNGFQVVKSTRTTISKHQAAEFYAEHEGRFFYNRLLTFMCSGPSEVYILAREDAIKKWRELMGPTKVYQAVYSAPGTIRAEYGLTDTRNATHGSDSVKSAFREMSVFFPNFNHEEWFQEEEPYFRAGKVGFDKSQFVHYTVKSSQPVA